VALVVVLLVSASGAALAGRGSPKKQITPADQARARSMTLRRSDFGPQFKRARSTLTHGPYCKATDESDLVVTGEAKSPDFDSKSSVRYRSVSSEATLYKTEAQSAQSWGRALSAAGIACLRRLWGDETKKEGGEIVFVRRSPYLRIAPRAVVARIKATFDGVPAYIDVIGLGVGRAQAGMYFLGGRSEYPRADEARLARVTAKRMRKAMRGA